MGFDVIPKASPKDEVVKHIYTLNNQLQHLR